MPPPDYWYLLARYVAGDASDDEKQALRTWMEEDPARQAMLEQVQAIYRAGGEEAEEPIDVDAAWQQVSGRVEEGSNKPPRRIDRGPSVRNRTRRSYRRAGMTALIVAVLAITAFLWFPVGPGAEEPWKTVTTDVGEQATVELDDGTTIRLNAASTLRYPPSFDSDERRIELDGEAYVEAASMPDRPFVVSVAAPPHVEARVIGTAFLVKGHADDGYTRVAVSEGVVAVAAKAEDPVRLEASDVAEVEEDGMLTVARGVGLAAHLDWLEGRLVFKDTPLREVAATVGRHYGVSIRLADASLGDRPITVSFDRRDTIDDVLEVLARTLDLRVDRTEEAIILSRASSP